METLNEMPWATRMRWRWGGEELHNKVPERESDRSQWIWRKGTGGWLAPRMHDKGLCDKSSDIETTTEVNLTERKNRSAKENSEARTAHNIRMNRYIMWEQIFLTQLILSHNELLWKQLKVVVKTEASDQDVFPAPTMRWHLPPEESPRIEAGHPGEIKSCRWHGNALVPSWKPRRQRSGHLCSAKVKTEDHLTKSWEQSYYFN